MIKSLLQPVLSYLRFVLATLRLKRTAPTVKLHGKVAINNVTFGKYNHIHINSILNDVKLGDFTYIANNCCIQGTKIGKYSCIGPNVQIGLGEHPSRQFISIHPVFYSTRAQVGVTFADKDYFEEQKNTIVGNDVWIGASAVISGGVNIGNGAIVASNAVVTKDIPAYAVVAGVPARIIRYRFKEDEIRTLQDLSWWDKDPAFLRDNYKLMHSVANMEEIALAAVNYQANLIDKFKS